MKAVILALFIGVVVAQDGYEVKKEYGQEKAYVKKEVVSYVAPYTYHGKYPGNCGKDGFYFRDEGSFVICSNGNHYVQPCAPGTRNSGYDNYEYGKSYYYRDFCDVNLVDYGYGAHRTAGYGYGGYGEGYGYGGYQTPYGGYGRAYDGYGRGYDGYGAGYGGYARGYGEGYGKVYGAERAYGYEKAYK